MNGRTAPESPPRRAFARPARRVPASAPVLGPILALLLLLFGAAIRAGPQQEPRSSEAAAGPSPAEPPAEQVYSNIQVLRGTPAEQILPSMELIAASLGVACRHCHVADAFEADDKPAKQTAREMMRMTRALNREQFEGQRRVTCFSCHRGGERPATDPPPAATEGEPSPSARMAEMTLDPETPAAEVFARHLEAVGGAEAAGAVSARTARGTATLFGGRSFPVVIRQERPARYTLTLDLPGGAQVSTLDGSVGIVETPATPPRRMDGSEVAVTTLANDLAWLTRPDEVLTDPRVAGRRIDDGREVIVVAARIEGHPVELSFDSRSGLLRSVLAWVETPFGRLLTRLDLGDYRPVDGLKTPASWTLSRPQGSFTVHLDDLEQEIGPA